PPAAADRAGDRRRHARRARAPAELAVRRRPDRAGAPAAAARGRGAGVRREAFEHVIRAAADVARDEIVVVGSQAILAQHPDAPEALLVSLELDVFPRNHPERADDIDGALGDGSPFHQTYGYYAHGVGPEAVVAPA